MAKFTKAMLRAGHRFQSPDGEVVATAERLKHWADTFATMKERGLSVPSYWDHQDDPAKLTPLKLSATKKRRSAKDTVGYLESFDLSKDGQEAILTFDVRGKSNIEAADENLAFVSPVIRDSWKDGDGNVYDDCIATVDFVQHPVDHRQSEFERVDDSVVCASLRLSLDGQMTTYKLADDEEEDEDTDNTSDSDSESSDNDSEESDVDNSDGRLSSVLDALAKLGVVLSDDTNESNFLQNLENALLTMDAMMNGGAEDLEVAQPDIALSTDQKMSLDRNNKAFMHLEKAHQKSVNGRLNSLLEDGRCTPVEYRDRQKKVTAVRLSLNDDGEHQGSTLESWIESRESVPKGTFWDAETRTRMANVVVQPHPSFDGDDVSKEDAKEIVDKLYKR